LKPGQSDGANNTSDHNTDTILFNLTKQPLYTATDLATEMLKSTKIITV